MTVLVTGASGFIGSHVVDALLSGGYRVRATNSTIVNNAEGESSFGLDGRLFDGSGGTSPTSR